MRIAVLADLPLLDRLEHRQKLLTGLADLFNPSRLSLYYIDNGVSAYAKAWRKRRRGSELAPQNVRTVTHARRLGIPVRFTGDPLETAPDLMVNLSARTLPEPWLTTPELGVIGAHYGRLPELRGSDCLRWSVLQGIPPTISLFRLSPTGLDRGSVLADRTVPQATNYADLRQKSQMISVDLILDYCAKPHPCRQDVMEPGPLYPPMGKILRDRVDRILAS